MALITRVARLFRADVNAVLDQLEEPEVLLRQAIRDMEEAVTKDEQYLAQLERERAEVVRREAQLENFMKELEQELDTCFAANEEALARPLMRRKLVAQRNLKLTGESQDRLQATYEQLSQRLDDERLELRVMRERAASARESIGHAAQHQSNDTSAGPAGHGWTDQGWADHSIRDEDVEIALLREKQRRAES